MNSKNNFNIPFAVSLDPTTGHKIEFYSIDEFVQGCINEQNFKVKSESYICLEYVDYDCGGCNAFPLVNPKKLTEIMGYIINGVAKKYDTHKIPHELIDSKKVSFELGNGVIAANTNKAHISYVLGTDDADLFLKLANAKECVVFHKDIDHAYQIINAGMPESIFRAMTGFNRSKYNQDLFIELNENFKTFEKHHIKQFFLEKINEFKLTIDPTTFIQESSQQWGELIPLMQSESRVNSVYPIDSLPSIAKEAVIAISEYVQAPISMVVQCVLGTMAHLAQAQVNAPHPFNPDGEPCSLFLVSEGQSGSRKSTCRELAERVIFQHERKQYEIYSQDKKQWDSRLDSLNKKDLEIYLAENPKPVDRSTLFSDVTIEAISGRYIDGTIKNASIASDEAGQFFGGYSMRAEAKIRTSGLLVKLYDDGNFDSSRSKSNLNGSGRAYDVRLVINLQGQRTVLANSLKDPILIELGFIPRFILTIPENLAGKRLQDEAYRAKKINIDERLTSYWERCRYLLDECPRPLNELPQHSNRYVMPMTNEAIKTDIYFYNLFESLQGKGKKYEYIQPFASRASQIARRLATIFAYFEGLSCIDAQVLKGACEIVMHSLDQWAMYADIEVKKENDAERLIKWLIGKCMQQKTDRLAYSYMQTSCPRPMQKNKNVLEMVIQQLEDSHYIKIEFLGRIRYVVVNPCLIKNVTK